ncbi:hypothetical protein CDV50_00240 [Haematobacter massiliensis]|nr:hypothetical protein CDV50_00240 [Haematobacter massiliensis]QBJ23310.1 hypothetical protein HmaOT1_02945 [Haematobacter massiliensis]
MVVKQERELMLGTGAKAPASGAAAGLPDGRYLAGFRANHLHLPAPGGRAPASAGQGFPPFCRRLPMGADAGEKRNRSQT